MYASSFSLMNCALAAAGLLGPLAAGGIEERFGWNATTIALGALCASGMMSCALVIGSKRAGNAEERLLTNTVTHVNFTASECDIS